jgi:hypothetical protein
MTLATTVPFGYHAPSAVLSEECANVTALFRFRAHGASRPPQAYAGAMRPLAEWPVLRVVLVSIRRGRRKWAGLSSPNAGLKPSRPNTGMFQTGEMPCSSP